MAYSDDAVKAKLSALNETQESIVTVAQWIMFHRRHASETAQLWLQRMKDSGAGKRLNLIYLANEVAQQSKARKKEDFLIAFSPILAEATSTAYKGATNEVQAKVRRVVEVWRQRQIFELPIQEAVEARIAELDKSRSLSKKSLLGGSLFSASSSTSAPPEIQPLVPMQAAINKVALAMDGTVSTANTEYGKLMDAQTPAPTPPVHAARLSALLKSLASAEGAVSESIKARRQLVAGLEKLLETNRTAIISEESHQKELGIKKANVETKKREVEDGIMRGLSAEAASPTTLNGTLGQETPSNGQQAPSTEPERPQIEELTPPPVESLTPVGSPGKGTEDEATTAWTVHNQEPSQTDDVPIPRSTTPNPTQAGFDLLSSLSMPSAYSYTADETNGPSNKRRRVDTDEGGFLGGDSMADLDDDVAELLRAESGGR